MTKVKGNSRSVLRQNWLAVSKHWCELETDNTTKHEDWNLMFAKTAESYLTTKVKGNSRSVQRQNWLAVSKHWCKLGTDDTIKHEDWNLVFANHREEDEIYPLTTIEIAEAQKKDQNLKI
jgi:hypothetical protein